MQTVSLKINLQRTENDVYSTYYMNRLLISCRKKENWWILGIEVCGIAYVYQDGACSTDTGNKRAQLTLHRGRKLERNFQRKVQNIV